MVSLRILTSAYEISVPAVAVSMAALYRLYTDVDGTYYFVFSL